jgi:type II secretory pathway pseudopilin PulG
MRSSPQSDKRAVQRRGYRPASRRGRGGFTLTELLVVIGIVILVLSVATPMVTRAWRSGDRARMAADLQAISTALEAYKQDHGTYPQVARAPDRLWEDGFDGARMLCRALIGPGPEFHTDVKYISDGKGADVQPPDITKPGPGFRTRGRSGQVYGPYLKLDQFKLANPGPAAAIDLPGHMALMDRYNRPILYYTAVGKPNIRLPKSYVWDRAGPDKPMYSATDNWNPARGVGGMPKETLALILGDLNINGQIDSTPGLPTDETPAYEGPYLLWSAGPDEIFGLPQGALPTSPPPKPEDVRKAIGKSDDITNFRD